MNRLLKLFQNSKKEKNFLEKEILLLKEENIRLRTDIKFWQDKFWELLESYNKLKLKEENKNDSK